MEMKKEVRGLKAGRYWSDCETVVLQTRISDRGVVVEVADLDGDIFYCFIIDKEDVVDFQVGEATGQK